MTRVNLIPASMLTDQHLRAELREIVRIIPLARRVHKEGRYLKVKFPIEFCLGTGHVTFFYNRMQFILDRIVELSNECEARKFKGIDDSYFKSLCNDVNSLPDFMRKDYTPTLKAKQLSLQRIEERISENPNFYKYKGEPIIYSSQKYLDLIEQIKKTF